ncbi:MAG: protein-methionine-sulfoxide reductase heme-binding subunit MsrQ [Plesiomonas sp.]
MEWRLKLKPVQINGLKLALHGYNLLVIGWLYYQLNHGLLGADPVKGLLHGIGRSALEMLYLTLLISPLAALLHAPLLLRLRRMLGLWCFAWASLHLLAYAALELGWDLPLFASEIIKRPYLVLGAASWLILLLLAITSNRFSQIRLGRHWQQLHFGVYLVAIAAPIHYVWSVKVLSPRPIIYLLIALLLLLWRVRRTWQQKSAMRKRASSPKIPAGR